MKILIAPLLATAFLALTADPPFAELGNLTSTAILGWYAWHTTTRSIPQLVADFRNELAAERTQRHTDTAAILQAIHELQLCLTNFHVPPGAMPTALRGHDAD
jgi:hypothetical protein